MAFEDLRLGQTAEFSKTVTEADVILFAGITGDFNPMHVDQVQAERSRFGGRVAHGMLTASFICRVLGMQLPGPGTIHLEQHLSFRAPVRIGDTVTAHVEILELIPERRRARTRTRCTNQKGEVVVEGEALVLVP
jgi:3-hydroxybutyryl-CoA dehydratase